MIYNPGEERDILNEITQSYLFKDILVYGNIEKPEVLEKILRALAFQVGSEVSYNEIAQLTGVDKKTVANYIHLLILSCLVRQKYNGFFKLFDTTPQKWLTAKRLELAYYHLTEKKKKPTEVYLEVGFEDLSHFSYIFKKKHGVSPNQLPAQR